MTNNEIKNKGFSMGVDYPPSDRRTYQQGFIEGALWTRENLVRDACKWLEDMLVLQNATKEFIEEAIMKLKQALED